MKVIFDTNVLVSAFLFDGSAAQKALFNLIKNGHEMYTSIEILKEFQNVVKRDFKYSDNESAETMKKMLSILFIVRPVETIEKIKDDKSDNKILECALAADADYILSYDKHLLKLGSFRNIKILKPEQLKV